MCGLTGFLGDRSGVLGIAGDTGSAFLAFFDAGHRCNNVSQVLRRGHASVSVCAAPSRIKFRHWYWIALVSLAVVFLVSYTSTAVDRLSLYLLPLQIVVYSRVYLLFNDRLFRPVSSVAVLLLYATVMFFWLNYANHANNWLSYQFYPFVGI